MINPSRLTLLAALLVLPGLSHAQGQPETLSLPADASIEMAVITPLTLDETTPSASDIIIHPVSEGSGSHALPNYCVVTGDAQIDEGRLRVTTKEMTCIEAEGGNSAIFSGELSAGAYDADGNFGLPVCSDGSCELTPDDSFLLVLSDAIAIEQQPNPSAEINAQRRQHGQESDSEGQSE